MREAPVLFHDEKECCGCSACYAICPQNAIAMVKNDEGFEYPRIDTDKCIKCYKCIGVCPFKSGQY